MANIFAKAKAGVTAQTGSKSKRHETVWAISSAAGGPPTIDQLNKAITEIHRLAAVRKQAETEEGVYKKMLQEFAEDKYVTHLAATGVEPETPLKVVNDKNLSCTYVVQDRTATYKVTDEQVDALVGLLGADIINDLVVEVGEFFY